MRRGLLVLALCLLVAGCASAPPEATGAAAEVGDPSFADVVDPLSGPGIRHDYRLVVDLLFEKDRIYNARIGMDLSMASWVDPAGQRFVLHEQRVPSHLVFTWRDGLFGRRPYHADVMSAVERRDRRTTFQDDANKDYLRALRHGNALIDRWRKEYRDLLEQHSWEHKPAIPFVAEQMRAQFGFYFGRDGRVPLDAEGRPRAGSVRDRIELVYRWHEPGVEDPVENPQFYKALTVALALFDTSPFPGGDPGRLAPNARWETRSEFAVSGLLRAAEFINSTVAAMLDAERRVAFPVGARVTDVAGETYTISMAADEFPDPSVGQGYRLVSFRRDVRYDRKERLVISDVVTIKGRGSDGDRFEVSIALKRDDSTSVAQ